MNGTDTEVDTDTMNRHVAKMVEEALKYTEVERVLEDGEQEDIFSPEYYEKLSDVKMPASKLELLVKMLRKQIMEYGKTNQMAAKKYQESLRKPSNSIMNAENILLQRKPAKPKSKLLRKLSEMLQNRPYAFCVK